MPVHASRPEARLCDSVYPDVVWLVWVLAGPYLARASTRVALRNPCDRCAGARPRPQIALRGPHKAKQRSGHGLSASCPTFMHTALCTAPSWGSPPGAPYLLPPPACVVPQVLPRGYLRIMVQRASAPSHLCPTAVPRAARGGTLFAHKLRACPRTTRPATHPPFPRRCIQLNARTELACRARRCRGARMPSRPHFCDFCGWLGF